MDRNGFIRWIFFKYDKQQSRKSIQNLNQLLNPIAVYQRSWTTFFIFLNCIRTERDNNIVDELMKVSVDITELISEYKNFLMQYPMDVVLKEYTANKTGKYLEDIPGNFSYLSRNKYHPVNSQACSCYVNNTKKLLCKHIFV